MREQRPTKYCSESLVWSLGSCRDLNMAVQSFSNVILATKVEYHWKHHDFDTESKYWMNRKPRLQNSVVLIRSARPSMTTRKALGVRCRDSENSVSLWKTIFKQKRSNSMASTGAILAHLQIFKISPATAAPPAVSTGVMGLLIGREPCPARFSLLGLGCVEKRTRPNPWLCANQAWRTENGLSLVGHFFWGIGLFQRTQEGLWKRSRGVRSTDKGFVEISLVYCTLLVHEFAPSSFKTQRDILLLQNFQSARYAGPTVHRERLPEKLIFEF